MARPLPQDVFTPGDIPTHTYVQRSHEEYERRLDRSLKTPGFLTSILGPSKAGKTVLVEKVVGASALRISGSDLPESGALWRKVLTYYGEAVSRSAKAESSNEVGTSGGAKAKVALPFLGSAQAGADAHASHTNTHGEDLQFADAGMDEAITLLIRGGQVLVIDDFHYVDRDVQVAIARQLKEAIARRLPVVILGVPHRGDDPIRANPDLRGRFVAIDVGSWSLEDLQSIGIKGFPVLELDIAKKDIERMAREALGSPQLMQALCLNACWHVEQNRARYPVGPQIGLGNAGVTAVCKATAAFTNAKTTFEMLKKGPAVKGVERTQHTMSDGTTGDNYAVLLRALCEEPPLMIQSYDEIRARVGNLGVALQKQQITGSLWHLNSIQQEKLPHDPVLEWDEEKEVLSIIDPYFLFYMRWEVWPR